MKVAVVSYGRTGGGAARAAHRHVAALNAAGITVTVHTAQGVFTPAGEPLGPPLGTPLGWKVKSKAASLLMRLQRSGNPVLHSPAFFPSGLADQLNRSDADIVNLHWVAGELLSVEEIGRIMKPIVWTMHDSWAFSGSEHHQGDDGDHRFSEGYEARNRPPLHAGLDLDRWVWQRKRAAWRRPMTVIAPGAWLASRARQSRLMGDWPVHVIANPLPLEVYHPRPASIARTRFGLRADTRYVLFSAAGTPDINKGWPYFAEAMTTLKNLGHPAVAVLLGGGGRDLATCDFPYVTLDSLTQDDDMAQLYSAVDLVSVPSRVETFPQMATEAMACGTPVVAFMASGLQDVVRHRETGYLARPFDCADLANGVAWALEPSNHSLLSQCAVQHAVREWANEVTSSKYRALFETVLAS